MRTCRSSSQPNGFARTAALLIGLAMTAAACGGSSGDRVSPVSEEPTPAAAPTIEPFIDATAAAGLDFTHFNGMTGERYEVEMIGPGAALFDFDNDGDLDVWMRQGKILGPGKTDDDAIVKPDGTHRVGDRFFRNDLTVNADGSRQVVLTDVTASIGVRVTDYGMGVATGDYDGDGWVDLYLTNFGPNRLLRNNGDGTFRDVTAASGADDDRWSVPAVFADFDRDGRLDLFVGNYIDFNFASHEPCLRPSSEMDYCGPLTWKPLPDRLLRNRSDGTFEDVTIQAGLASAYGNGLGVLVDDLDRDGWLDIYVANDANDNLLWISDGKGGFKEDALLRGCAVNGSGGREGSMGVTGGDFDGDGDTDIFVTHISTETNTLYVNDGSGYFRDGTMVAGLATPSGIYTGFGTRWLDVDNDGWLDLWVGNGEVKVLDELERAGDPFPLRQINQLFRNRTGGSFEEITAAAGEAFRVADVTRGAAFGDIDNDGDTDLVEMNDNGPARLLLNQVGQRAHWLGLVLRDRHGHTGAQGARVEVHRGAGAPLVRRAGTDGSYCSANDPRVLVGLGDRPDVTHVRVHWPSGHPEDFPVEATDRYTTLVEGRGRPVEAG